VDEWRSQGLEEPRSGGAEDRSGGRSQAKECADEASSLLALLAIGMQ
jgi:hypothetical protein